MKGAYVMENYNIDLSNATRLNNSKDIIKTLMKKNHIRSNRYLHPSLKMIDRDIHLTDKHQIHDMKKGTQLIKYAIKNNWKMVIYSDYDVDGITSNTIMYSLLKRLGAKYVLPYCPDRVKDGYGLNMLESKKMVKQGINLVITTDNGIASVKEVKYLRKHGVDVIITDHHSWKRNKDGSVSKRAIPKANAIIMPNCPFDTFHFNDFCGGGIAFMIASYMLGRVATEYLDLACLATVADNVSLRKENRVIVYYGLKELRKGTRLGIRTLAQVANIDLAHMTATGLSFSIIPRLNALGRISNANYGRKLLLATA